MVYSYRSELDFSDITIRINISISVKSYDEKIAENYRDCYVNRKCIVSKLSEISIPNFNSTNGRLCKVFLIVKFLIVSKFHVPIINALRKLLQSDRAGSSF